MQVIDSILKQEKERNRLMLQCYTDRLNELPQGALSIKSLNGKKYCYLNFRQNGKVVSKYMGSEEQAVRIREEIEERKHLQDMIKMLENEYRRIIKMEAIR